MEWLLLNQNSIGRLSPVILSVMIAVYLMLKKERDSALLFFALYFAAAALFHFGYFTVYSVYDSAGAYGWILASLAPFGLAFLIQFAYRFPGRRFCFESYLVFAVTILLSLLAFGEYIFHFLSSPIAWHNFSFNPGYRSFYIPVLTVVFYLWASIVFIRQWHAVARESGDDRKLLVRILHPESRDARTAQCFAIAVGVDFLFSLVITLWIIFRFFPAGLIDYIQNTGFLLVYLLYLLFYLNNSTRPTSLIVKLIGITMAAVLGILSLAGQLAVGKMVSSIESNYQMKTDLVLEKVREDGRSFPSDIEFIVSRPVSDGLFGSRLSVRFERGGSFDVLKLLEKESRDRDLFLKSQRSAGSPYNAVIPLSGQNDLDSDMKLVQGKDVIYFYFTRISGNDVFYIGYDYRTFRQRLNETAVLFFFLIVFSSISVLLFFPFLFKMSVIDPIRSIMGGLRVVNGGCLDIELAVQYDDEIGFLTAAFNKMVSSLRTSKKYEDHYALQLENAFLKIENSRKEIEDNFAELRAAHDALAESESRYRVLNAELELRVSDRTSRLEKTNAELLDALIQLKQTQTELIRNEKMAALGDMVAGIAHEINTPLGVAVTASSFISRNISHLLSNFRKGSLTRGDMQSCLESCEQSSEIIYSNLRRAGELVQSFKLVAADQSSEERRSFDLCEYINDVLVSLHPKIRKTGHTVNVSCDGSISVYSYPGSFSQIVTNLVINSLVHAFPGRNDGTMSIRITVEGDTMLFTYADDGCGIASENIDKIFAPFFTTKRQSGGTGLGLHIVYNIVTQKLAGTIEVSSVPGQGTIFAMRIPMSQMRLPNIT